MRKAIAVAVALVALNAFAGTISSVSPSSIQTRTGEYFMTANGSGFTGADEFIISGNAGTFRLAVNSIDPATGAVTGWVPVQVVNTPGIYNLTVVTNGVNSNTVTFDVFKPGRPPLKLHVPELLVAVSRGRTGAGIKYDVTTTGGDSASTKVDCDPLSGSTFPYGLSYITCVATDGFGERDDARIAVNVYDGVKPTLVVPKSFSVDTTNQEGEYVKWETSATDDIDSFPQISCAPASGSFFRPGTTRVTCEALDASLNSDVAAFDVTVYPPDRGRLTLQVPEYVKEPAQSKQGAIVYYTVTASGSADPTPNVTCSPESGSHFAINRETPVYCTATDDFGAVAENKFIVYVYDDGTLMMSDVTEEATSPEGADVTYELKAEDWEHEISCSPAPGSRFALGTTRVQCESTDSRGKLAKGSFQVEVKDTIAPHINRAQARAGAIDLTRGVVTVTLEVDALDAADLAPQCTVTSLTSDTAGDFDWRIKNGLELEVRSSTPRAFRAQVSCVDASGNRSTTVVPLSLAAGPKRNAKIQ